MKAAEIRASFLDFFQHHHHQLVPSSPLVPQNDPTLFFTNAGMVQFKNVFTGAEQRPYRRAASVQKCLRVSGKHNDLENVGRTPRHHTFFEMLGNFSFGDYFKEEAITWGWELLTERLGIPADRLWVTIHHSDDEAWGIWHHRVGVPDHRIQRLGDKDNFWSMGETGPCGPCSEIHYDHGPAIDPNGAGPASESPRYVEIWNLVFMQYDRDVQGTLHPLPRPSIDTGAGLERIAAVLQGVYSNYDTDCFQPLIHRAAALAGVTPGQDPEADVALRVIADHARAAAFLVADGVTPSNEERGYVLRRILRRAIRYGVKLDIRDPFLWRVADTVVDEMHPAWPELAERRAFVQEVVRLEEERFAETLHKGLAMLGRAVEALPGPGPRVLDGDLAFRLYDTYGFPVDLTRLIAEEQGVQVDEVGYQVAMERQRAMGRAAWKGSGQEAMDDLHRALAGRHPVAFTGYTTHQDEGTVLALVRGGQEVEALEEGQEGELVTDRTPFYGESGGQVGDTGTIQGPTFRLVVTDTSRPHPDLVVHQVRVEQGRVQVGASVVLAVDDASRTHTRRNHTATHLLHKALKQVVGGHVAQKGSLVGPHRLRFDFSHHRPLEPAEVHAVEDVVNAEVLRNHEVRTDVMTLDEARASGAEALFGEKYGERVRVVRAGDFSAELCGGTHVSRTGDIGPFIVVSEAGIAAGVRRIEALTGQGALAWIRGREARLLEAAEHLKAAPDDLVAAVDRVLGERRVLEKELATVRREAARAASGDLFSQARTIGDLKVLSAELPGDPATLREEAERLRDRLGERAVVVLGAREDDRVRLVACASRDIAGKGVHAGQLVKLVAEQVGGSGGGRPDFAQAGGKDPAALAAALESVYAKLGG